MVLERVDHSTDVEQAAWMERQQSVRPRTGVSGGSTKGILPKLKELEVDCSQ